MELKFTDNPAEIQETGKKILEEKSEIYTEKVKSVINDYINKMMSDKTFEERQKTFYRSIYDYWAYGFTIWQEFMFNLEKKSHEEKFSYLTERNRMVYCLHMNDKATADNLLENKYNAYNFLKDYYRRDVILVEGEDDYKKFCAFVEKHPNFAVKPVDLGIGFGVHKESLKNYDSPRDLFDELLQERKKILRGNKDKYISKNRDVNLILEELIEQVPELSKIHPASLNSVRITTLKVNGDVNIFYPCLRMGARGSFVDNAGSGGFFAGIDPATGVVRTNLFDKNTHGENFLACHPDSGVKILGFKIPRWDEAISLAKILAGKLEKINYVGWDFALTPKGWCVVEGNAFGDLGMPQIVYQRGLKKDLEKIIGWQPSEKFWWK